MDAKKRKFVTLRDVVFDEVSSHYLVQNGVASYIFLDLNEYKL